MKTPIQRPDILRQIRYIVKQNTQQFSAEENPTESFSDSVPSQIYRHLWIDDLHRESRISLH